ncbi:TRAP transporter large permease subunit [Iocasia frigidifontis]|uniref:TRAP transporter large permease subunit n=1 Tax=Iocasia fonsfrigidae TaxID=2682810 RepID=A0A8A7KE72_9FIRM|nr:MULTISPECIES: TRAP transporter large permease [Halanaerobiaceae]AZO93301.1 TRAP transporter large permease [Halocella sp. SP3-1]QTL99560.1 TRAP transporter large permease subunit [Iocasia fonsfrigidae]
MAWWLFIPFIITMILGVPIAFSLATSSLVFLLAWGVMPIEVIAQRFFSSIDSFVLLAIPFFILAGELMNRTGITKSLVEFANLIIGRVRGGLAQVNILASILFAGLTGAGVADTSALGSILIPAMEEQGFEPEYSAAVTAASSVIGPIIPPSIIMVVFGSIMGLSVGSLFAAGIIPGIVIGLALMVMAYIISKKKDHPYREGKVSSKEFWVVTKKAIYSLIMPIIIVGGIFSGLFTPTEAAAIAVAYALVIGFLVFKSLSLEDLQKSLIKSGITTSVIIMIIGAANVFGWALSIERIPQFLASFLLSLDLTKVTFLLLVNAFLLFMGMIMETGANAILLGPILMPIAIQLGIDPLHFALIMLVNLNIGLATPPLGVCLFVACPIADISMGQITRSILPFMIMEIIALLIITFMPEVVLFVPRLLGY